MSTIVAEGKARNLTSTPGLGQRVPNPELQRFVTFLTEAGSVHTIIVDADRADHAAEDLLKWFNHTRVGVEMSSHHPTSPLFRVADDVLRAADEAVGFLTPVLDTVSGGENAQQKGGA